MNLLRVIILIPLILSWSTAASNAALIENPDGTILQLKDDGSILMWLKDTRYIATSGYAAGNTNNGDGTTSWAEATAWIDYLNATYHLGYNDWRLPVSDQCQGTGCSQSELGSLYSDEGITDSDPSPFINVSTPAFYWTQTELQEDASRVMHFRFSDGLQEDTPKTGNQDFPWAVRSLTLKKGDLNRNAVIDVEDLIIALQLAAGIPPSVDIFINSMDANGNGKIDMAEAAYILQWLAGLRNTAPVLDPIGDKSVDEGATLEFAVSASDVEKDALTFAASNLPTGAEFDQTLKEFSWTPDYTQSGSYDVTFTVQDTFGAEDSETITIDVIPVLTASQLFPLTVGNYWDFREDGGWYTFRNSIAGTKTVDTTTTYRYQYEDGTQRYYTSDVDGVRVFGEYVISQYFTGEVLFDSPLLYVENTVQVGDPPVVSDTTYTLEIGNETFDVEVTSTTQVLAIEDVVTQNDVLTDCVKISNQITQDIYDSTGQWVDTVVGDTEYIWLYEGVGPVKVSDGFESYTIYRSYINGVFQTY
jgi:hypothetical protein